MADTKPRVHGLGGVFFKSDNPEQLSAWYAKHLGFGVEDWGGALFHWNRIEGQDAPTGERGCTVWSPFKASTEYFAPSDKPFMLNFRVDDLDATLAALREEGCNVLERGEDSEQGKFGYVMDPEGHLVELWQPNPNDPSQAPA
ncbi:VOC family protein [Lysobacter koreensis]|uniref:VOC family protein n=1 Tax=Lysobacter koreensis TaxID=266122 RepID=A0ABW2YU49_9GAMM